MSHLRDSLASDAPFVPVDHYGARGCRCGHGARLYGIQGHGRASAAAGGRDAGHTAGRWSLGGPTAVPKTPTQNLLAGLATCALCGGGLIVETSLGKRGRVHQAPVPTRVLPPPTLASPRKFNLGTRPSTHALRFTFDPDRTLIEQVEASSIEALAAGMSIKDRARVILRSGAHTSRSWHRDERGHREREAQIARY